VSLHLREQVANVLAGRDLYGELVTDSGDPAELLLGIDLVVRPGAREGKPVATSRCTDARHERELPEAEVGCEPAR
jgi:hypothetical protein